MENGETLLARLIEEKVVPIKFSIPGCVFSLLLVFTLVACDRTSEFTPVEVAGTEPSASQSEEPARAFDPLNGLYQGFDDLEGPVQLAQGQWQGEPWAVGSAERPELSLMGDISAVGDLDGDGAEDQVYLLNLTMGGTGQLLYLAAVTASANNKTPVTVSLVGDRVRARRLAVENGQAWLDVLQAGPEDAMCCPGELASRSWVLGEDQFLVEQPSNRPASRFGAASLQGTEWQLQRWSWDEPADESGVTLVFGEGGISGHSGCNQYRASISDGKSPGEVEIGPTMGTRMACPEEQSAVETRFLQALGAASKLGYSNGQLILDCQVEGKVQTLFFSRKQP